MDDKNHPLYTEAQYGLGMLYLKPRKKFIIPNDAKGIRLLQEAAEAGEPLACLEFRKCQIVLTPWVYAHGGGKQKLFTLTTFYAR